MWYIVLHCTVRESVCDGHIVREREKERVKWKKCAIGGNTRASTLIYCQENVEFLNTTTDSTPATMSIPLKTCGIRHVRCCVCMVWLLYTTLTSLSNVRRYGYCCCCCCALLRWPLLLPLLLVLMWLFRMLDGFVVSLLLLLSSFKWSPPIFCAVFSQFFGGAWRETYSKQQRRLTFSVNSSLLLSAFTLVRLICTVVVKVVSQSLSCFYSPIFVFLYCQPGH